ncbi:fasciclin domain-containing protein [Halobaculum halobium]
MIAGGTGAVTARGGGRGKRDGASAENSVVEAADELGFSTLLTAVTNADPVVADTLTNDDQYTVFAPTNEAFEDFFETVETATGLTAADLLEDPNNLLTDTLLFHVTGGRRYASSVVNAPAVETLLGEPVSVDGTTLDGRASIVSTDVEASNGVVHAIDAVLTTPTVDQVLEG